MFENSFVFAYMKNGAVLQVLLDAPSNQSIAAKIGKNADLLMKKTAVLYNGEYMPACDERLTIRPFQLPSGITEALANALNLEKLGTDDIGEIKSIFLAEKHKQDYNVVFQNITARNQYSSKRIMLFFCNGTFMENKQLSLMLSESADCIYINGELTFTTFFTAKQALELGDYYKEITDAEVKSFYEQDVFVVYDTENMIKNSDMRVKGLIFALNKVNFFQKYKPKEIKSKADEYHIQNVNLSQEGRLILPASKDDLKLILRFMNNEIYKGVFGGQLLQTDSKREFQTETEGKKEV